MTLWQGIVLGVVQGLTEFLPVSSTAHLRVVPKLLGWEDDPGAAFSAVIQCGSLAAISLYFRSELVRIGKAAWRGLRHGRPCETLDASLAWMILLATLPIVAFGALFEQQIKTSLRSLYVVSAALIGLALLLAAVELLALWRRRQALPPRGLDEVGWGDAAAIGLAQALSLVPGASRSGVTITGGMLRNLDRATAARFSFLLSLPAVFAAGMHQLVGAWSDLTRSPESVATLLAATFVSGAVGYASIVFLLGYLKRHTTWAFIVYRLLLGGLLLVLLQRGVLEP
jgi:undecaprenyl-diphosphatase